MPPAVLRKKTAVKLGVKVTESAVIKFKKIKLTYSVESLIRNGKHQFYFGLMWAVSFYFQCSFAFKILKHDFGQLCYIPC